jgi:5-methylcytosine-specific restriction endonuclease McrA
MALLMAIIIVLMIVAVFCLAKNNSSDDTRENFEGIDVSRKYNPVDNKRRGIAEFPANEADNKVSDIIARMVRSRRGYYRDVYLKSAAWNRKRYLVLKRDNFTCVHCGRTATQVHHKKYARLIGKEPLVWLESVCKICHEKLH